ncbi:hypothetical protein E5F43_06150, partial [Clostridioides difficile]
INNVCKNRRNYGDSLWRISKTYFSMQNSMKQEPCDFSHGRFSVAINIYHLALLMHICILNLQW